MHVRSLNLETQQQAGPARPAQTRVPLGRARKLAAQIIPGGLRVRHELLAIEHLEHRECGGGRHRIAAEG